MVQVYKSYNSVFWASLLVLSLSGVVAMILLKALSKDISRYNGMDHIEDLQEDYGWKLVHADVFRTPKRPLLLGALIGSGMQCSFSVFILLILTYFGITGSDIDAVSSYFVIFYVLCAAFSGYYSAMFFKMIGGESWKKNILMTSLFAPL